ncbi:MAG TPA: hypothetical protein PKD85_03385, partial [Saprospiraceae bacterium]|nr:hypothetical protein [Saprospiraceae bacterium]
GETILRVPFNVDRGTVQNFTFAAGVGTCTVAGWYDITATINARQGEIELGTPGYAQVLIVKNENPFDITEGVMASQSTAYFAQVVLDGIFTVSSKALVQFDVGDTVTIKIYNFANAVAQEFTILTSTVLSGLKVS